MTDKTPHKLRTIALLRQYYDDIEALLDAYYTHENVIHWLAKEKDITVTLSNFRWCLYKFRREQKQANGMTQTPTHSKEPSSPATGQATRPDHTSDDAQARLL